MKALLFTPIFQNINSDPPGTKNYTSMDIFYEYGYQETLGWIWNKEQGEILGVIFKSRITQERPK